jgi:hypothetical protein
MGHIVKDKPKKAGAEATTRARYQDDLYTWVFEQVALLKAGRVDEIDAANIAEELADVGNEQYDKLESALAVLLMHLLKWDHQPQLRSKSWALTVREQRRRIGRVLKKNPGLKPHVAEAVADGYLDGRDRAAIETGIDDQAFPAACPYSWDDIITRPIEVDPAP